MKISKKVINHLAGLITGDTKQSPYLSGSKLVMFFNEFGFDDTYGEGFPPRKQYVVEKIEGANGNDVLKEILEEFVDPIRYIEADFSVNEIVEAVNSLIKYDGYELVKINHLYKIVDIEGKLVKPESVVSIGHKYVFEQVTKCYKKISTNDYNGAITNARTLCEYIFIHIIESIEKKDYKSDGNLITIWKTTKKALKIDLEKEEYPEYVFQVVSGINTSLNGLAALSNNAGDRHASNFRTKKHHAKLAVNLAITICEFLIDVLLIKESKIN